jgi:hypothetical protein
MRLLTSQSLCGKRCAALSLSLSLSLSPNPRGVYVCEHTSAPARSCALGWKSCRNGDASIVNSRELGEIICHRTGRILRIMEWDSPEVHITRCTQRIYTRTFVRARCMAAQFWVRALCTFVFLSFLEQRITLLLRWSVNNRGKMSGYVQLEIMRSESF